MKLIPLFLILFSCQDFNSNSSDKERYGNVSLENDPQFQVAYKIIQDKCVNCHSSQIHAIWSTYTSNAAWISSGKVIPGDSQNSEFITRIINSGGAHSDMPLNGNALPDQEYEALTDWIDNLE